MRSRPSPVPSAWLAVPLLLSTTVAAQQVPESFTVALGLLQRGLHQEAAPYLERFVQDHARHPRIAEGHYRLGTCYLETKRPKQGIASLRKALAGRGNGGGQKFRFEPECRYRLADALVAEKQLEPALKEYQTVRRNVGEDHYLQAAARYGAAECLRDLQRDKEAVAAFVDCLEVAQGDQARFAFPAAYQAGFACLRLDRSDLAMELFEQAAAAAGDKAAKAECAYLEGDAALRAGQRDRAEKALRRSVQMGGEFVDDATYSLGFCLLEKNDRSGALAAFRRVANTGGSEFGPQARLEVGRLLYQDGNAEAARQELGRVLQAEGLDKSLRCAALELRGLAALDAGAVPAARKDFQAALPLAASDAERARIQFGQGEAALEAGQWAPAIAAYQAAEKGAKDLGLRGDACYGRILALHKQGEFSSSQRAAEAMLRDLPKHRLADLVRFAIAENLFAQKEYVRADKAYQAIPLNHEKAPRATFKRAWCAYLAGQKAAAAERFGALAESGAEDVREEALSMTALASLESKQSDEALAAADRYKARYPNGAYLARTERVAARVLRSRKDLRGAAARMAVAARASKSPEEAAADGLERAELVFQQGDFDAARKLYEPLVARNDRTGARATEGLAWCAYELGDDAECAQWIDRGKRHPKIGTDRSGLLRLEYALHHRAEAWPKAASAAQAFLAAFAEHPRRGEMVFSLGVAQARGGELADARKTLTAATKTRGVPRADRAFYELGWVCRRMKDEPAALAAFQEVARRSKDEDLKGEAELHLGVAALEKDPAGSKALLSGVKGVYRGRALYRLGFHHFEAERWQEALPAFSSVVQIGRVEPLFFECVHLVGMCRYELGQWGQAAGRFRQLLQGDAKHPRAATSRLFLGECAVRSNQPGEAVGVLGQFLAGANDETAKVDRARAHLWLGRARQLRKEWPRAENEFQKVTDLSEGPLAAEAQFRIGEVRRSQKKVKEAADAFVKLPILYTHEPWTRRGLLEAGRCYEQLNQSSKSRRFYEELVNRYPKSNEAQQARARLRSN